MDLSSAVNADHWPGFTDGRGLEILASHLVIILASSTHAPPIGMRCSPVLAVGLVCL